MSGDNSLLTPAFFDGQCSSFPTAATSFKLCSSGGFFSARPEPCAKAFQVFRLGDNHLRILQAQKLLNMHIGGLGQLCPWRYDDGRPWLKLPESGAFCERTQDAVKRYQRMWSLPQHGLLCPLTRTILRPITVVKGCLSMRNTCRAHPNLQSPTIPQRSAPLNLRPPSSKVPKSDVLNASGALPVPSTDSKDGDGNKNQLFNVELSLSEGAGASGPLYTSKSSSGNPVKKAKPEVDNKIEFEAAFSTKSLLDGRLKLDISTEWDQPYSKKFRDSTLSGNIKLELDDAVKFGDWGALNPYIQGSAQSAVSDFSKVQGSVKGGVEMSVELGKGFSLKADGNVGAQHYLRGADKKDDAKLVIPWEANVNLEYQPSWLSW